MKKLSVLFVALAVAASASAAGQFKAHVRNLDKKIVKEQVMTKKDIQAAKKTPARVINEQPEGQAYNYTTTGRADYASSGYLYGAEMSGNTRVVFAEDGTTVYVRNILYNSGSNFGNNWVQGTLEGNTLTIPMGQSIYWSDQYQADVVLTWGEVVLTEDEKFAFVADESVTEVTYLLGEDGSLTMQGGVAPTSDDSSANEYYLGTGLSAIWTDDGSWSGFCNFTQVLSNPVVPPAAPTLITEQPEGDLYTYYRAGACIYSSLFGLGETEVDGKMNVVFGKTDGALDGKVYIQNPMWWLDGNNTWVEGTYDWMTGLITIPVGQYLSWDEENEYGVQLMWGSTYVYQDVDENGEEGYYLGTELDEEAENIYFMIGDDVIELQGSEGDINAEFPENYNATGLYAMYNDDQTWAGALEFGVKGQIVHAVPAIPADPTLPEEPWYDCGNEGGYSTFDFKLPTTDVDGNMIDPECLSYSIFTDDDQIFTFDPAVYTYDDLTEPITEVPYWLYASGVDFHKGYVYFYRTNAEGFEPMFTRRIGVQAIYTVDVPETEGAPKKAPVVNKSNIVYYELPNTAIESVKAELDVNAPVYNIMGQKMNANNLPAGVYIQNGKKFVIK
jgi:hypothetical protein